MANALRNVDASSPHNGYYRKARFVRAVTVPVSGDVSGAEKRNVVILSADFRPLTASAFDIS